MPKAEPEQYSDEEADRRYIAALRRGLNTPYKPMKDFVGTTDRAKAMARRRKANPAQKAEGHK